MARVCMGGLEEPVRSTVGGSCPRGARSIVWRFLVGQSGTLCTYLQADTADDLLKCLHSAPESDHGPGLVDQSIVQLSQGLLQERHLLLQLDSFWAGRCLSHGATTLSSPRLARPRRSPKPRNCCFVSVSSASRQSCRTADVRRRDSQPRAVCCALSYPSPGRHWPVMAPTTTTWKTPRARPWTEPPRAQSTLTQRLDRPCHR